jgi:hypothetical protein
VAVVLAAWVVVVAVGVADAEGGLVAAIFAGCGPQALTKASSSSSTKT